jgi:hypothetical protein
VAVPATVGAAFEVVEAEAVLELAVIVLDLPPDLGQPHQPGDGVSSGRVDSQYLAGSSASGGHSASSQHAGWLPSAARGMRRLAGRTRIARKQLVMAAAGLPLVALVPCRQVTYCTWLALAMASWRTLTGAVR